MTEPAAVTQFRTMLLACASISGAGITTDRLYYPAAVAASDDATTPAAKPYGVLSEERHNRRLFLEPGVLGLPSGTLVATFHFDSDVGTVEAFCRSVCSELMTQAVGLPIREATAELSAEPTPASLAADETVATAAEIVATIVVDWGLS